MKHEVKTFEELEEFIKPLKEGNKFIIDIQELADGGYMINWQEHKTYISVDGKEYPDEVWVTEAGEMKLIQDLEPEHCKNIIRMILRQDRKISESLNTLTNHLAAVVGTADLDNDNDTDQEEPRVLH